jgi:PPOX class probable F420-dependent enzyme
MNDQEAREYVAKRRLGTLATLMPDGRPQLSTITYFLDDDGTVKISSPRHTVKARNVRRDPRVALHIPGDNAWQYLVVEGRARWAEDNLAAELRRYYERAAGKPHPDWQEYDEAMIKENRVLLEITIDRMYPLQR